MDTAKLSADVRSGSGKGICHRLRNQHKIPGILYGRGQKNLLVEFSEMDIKDIIDRYGEHAVLKLDINNSTYKAIIKEVQRDPVKRNIQHIDVKYLNEGEIVHADIPVIIKGEKAVRSKGGIVQKITNALSVEAFPENLPKYFKVDVSKLNIGDKLTVKDVEFSSDLTIADDLDSVIAVITGINENEKSEDENDAPIIINAEASNDDEK